MILFTWAASWQNQQNECTPSKDSDQPGHLPSLIRVFAVRSMGSYGPKLFFMWTGKTLIRLGRCPGWSVFTGRTCHFAGFVMVLSLWSHRKLWLRTYRDWDILRIFCKKLEYPGNHYHYMTMQVMEARPQRQHGETFSPQAARRVFTSSVSS